MQIDDNSSNFDPINEKSLMNESKLVIMDQLNSYRLIRCISIMLT